MNSSKSREEWQEVKIMAAIAAVFVLAFAGIGAVLFLFMMFSKTI